MLTQCAPGSSLPFGKDGFQRVSTSNLPVPTVPETWLRAAM